jgi:hypothetical protein
MEKYFDNLTLGQFVLTGIKPIKVYVGGRYLIVTDTDDIEDPLYGYGMMQSGEMASYDYRLIDHLLIGNKTVTLDMLNKSAEGEADGEDEPAAEGEAATAEEKPEEEKPAKEKKKEESVRSSKLTDIMNEKAESQNQQQAAAIALQAKKGKISKAKLKGASKEMFKMSKAELEKFAKTKHKGLPVKVTKESLQPILENILGVEAANSLFELLTSEQQKYWALYGVSVYENALKTATTLPKLQQIYDKMKQRIHRKDTIDALDYFYTFRKKELGINESSLNEESPADKKVSDAKAKYLKAKMDAAKEDLAALKKGIGESDEYRPIGDDTAYSNMYEDDEDDDYDEDDEELDFDVEDDEEYDYDGDVVDNEYVEDDEQQDVTAVSDPYTIKVGDLVHNTDCGCKHYGSKGFVISIDPTGVRYSVTNQGPFHRLGDIVTKDLASLESI